MKLVDAIRKKLKPFRVSVVVVSGREKSSAHPVQVLLIGSGTDRQYMIEKIFAEGFSIDRENRIWLFQLPSLIRKSSADFIAACKVEPQFRGHVSSGASFFLPRWIGGDTSLEDAIKRSHQSRNIKADRARIRKNGLSFELSSDPEMFRFFYNDMYRPYIKNIFGELGAPARFPDVEKAMPDSMLMMVIKDGMAIAGQIIVFEGDSARGWTLGVLNGDRIYTRLGAVAALYIFAIEELARSKQVSRINFGGSRPFLNDGALQFKKKWGINLRDASPSGFVFLKIKDTAGVRSFLEHNPFVYKNDSGQFVGAIFNVKDDNRLSSASRDAIKAYLFHGLSALEIYGSPRDAVTAGCEGGDSKVPIRHKQLSEIFSS